MSESIKENLDIIKEKLSRYMEIDKKLQENKLLVYEKEELKNEIVEIVGPNHYFDDGLGNVWKTDKSKGEFVSYDNRNVIKRTKMDGDKTASLSRVEADEYLSNKTIQEDIQCR